MSSSSFRNRSLLGPLPCQLVGYCAICSLLRLTVKVFSTCTSVSNCYQGLVRRSVACPGHALARLWCHDHLFQLVFHESALGAFGMSLIVCLSWTCSFSMSMVSRSLAFIFSYIGSFFRLQNTIQKLYHQLSTHVLLWLVQMWSIMLLQTLTTFSGRNQRIYDLVKAVLDDALVAWGRWTSERTLVRYVQVEVFCLHHFLWATPVQA